MPVKQKILNPNNWESKLWKNKSIAFFNRGRLKECESDFFFFFVTIIGSLITELLLCSIRRRVRAWAKPPQAVAHHSTMKQALISPSLGLIHTQNPFSSSFKPQLNIHSILFFKPIASSLLQYRSPILNQIRTMALSNIKSNRWSLQGMTALVTGGTRGIG